MQKRGTRISGRKGLFTFSVRVCASVTSRKGERSGSKTSLRFKKRANETHTYTHGVRESTHRSIIPVQKKKREEKSFGKRLQIFKENLKMEEQAMKLWVYILHHYL